MYSHPPIPPKPEPNILEQEFLGMPVWGHLLLGVCTLGLYFLILPFIALYAGAQWVFAKAMAAVFMMVVGAVWYVIKTPAQALYRWTRS